MPVRTPSSSQAVKVPAGVADLAVARAEKRPRDVRVGASAPHEQYANALHRHLEGLAPGEIDFFINPRRVEMLDRLIGAELQKPDIEILNVASGPFAVEFYLKLTTCRIESFDRERRLVSLHKELTARGLIAPSQFTVADVAKFDSDHAYDVVLINDLFYSRHIDFYGLLPKYADFVKPGGLLYFDIQDERAGPLWRAFGKDDEFRRYNLDEVVRVLRQQGFSVEAREPALGIKGGLDGLLRRGMWHLAGLANSYAFVARKA